MHTIIDARDPDADRLGTMHPATPAYMRGTPTWVSAVGHRPTPATPAAQHQRLTDLTARRRHAAGRPQSCASRRAKAASRPPAGPSVPPPTPARRHTHDGTQAETDVHNHH